MKLEFSMLRSALMVCTILLLACQGAQVRRTHLRRSLHHSIQAETVRLQAVFDSRWDRFADKMKDMEETLTMPDEFEGLKTKEDSMIQKFLELFGANFDWFALKDHVFNKDRDPTKITKDRNGVSALVRYRIVDLIETAKVAAESAFTGKAEVLKRDSQKKFFEGGFLIQIGPYKITMMKGGSETLISDIDLTCLVEKPGEPKNSYEAKTQVIETFQNTVKFVESFNTTFRAQHSGVDSGIYYDINMYASDTFLYGNPLITASLQEREIKHKSGLFSLGAGWYAVFAAADHATKISEYESMKTRIKGKVSALKSQNDKVYNPLKDVHGKSFMDTDDEFASVYTEAQTKAETDAMLESPATARDMEIENNAYINLLHTTSESLKNCLIGHQKSHCKYLYAHMTLAMIAANEAYFPPGSVFVVIGVKRTLPGGGKGWTINDLLESVLMNGAYAIEHFKPEYPGGIQATGVIKAAKYIDRMLKEKLKEDEEEKLEFSYRASYSGPVKKQPYIPSILESWGGTVADSEKEAFLDQVNLMRGLAKRVLAYKTALSDLGKALKLASNSHEMIVKSLPGSQDTELDDPFLRNLQGDPKAVFSAIHQDQLISTYFTEEAVTDFAIKFIEVAVEGTYLFANEFIYDE